jgi:hypothetical protein
MVFMAPEFTQDWFEGTGARANFEKHLAHLKGKPHLRFLEIGSFEGRSACWLLENILTGENALLHCVDTWKGSREHKGIDFNLVFETFKKNIAPHAHKVVFFQDDIYGAQFDDWCEANYLGDQDFIYIDGSHEAADVLRDAVFAWELAKPGCIICFDDYRWDVGPTELDRPRLGIDAFLACYYGRYELIESGYQLWVRKR